MLLTALLSAIDANTRVSAVFDSLLQLPDKPLRVDRIVRVRPSLLGRLWGEWSLYRLARTADIVLCFGNLSPLLKTRNRVAVFAQNRYQLERRGLGGFSSINFR